MKTRKCSSLIGTTSSIFVAACATALAFFSREGSAVAQARFGDKGQLAITGENLFTFSSERVGRTFPEGERSVTSNRFGFLYSQGSPTPRGPQVGGHFFVIPSLSIGATLGYEARGGSTTQPIGNRGIVTQDTDSISAFIFVPKVGYALMFNNVIGFWFRGGPGFFRIGSTDATDARVKDSDTFWLISLDALLVVSPVPNFGFYVGPQADLSFSGTESHTDNNGIETSRSASYRSLGLGLGLIGYIGL
jgi:hypothetical protein